MAKRSRKRKREDANQAAPRVVRESTAGSEYEEKLPVLLDPKRASRFVSQLGDDFTVTEAKPKKNPHAVALGRRGGKKGGPARAKKLSAKRRSAIARKAANTRWNKYKAKKGT